MFSNLTIFFLGILAGILFFAFWIWGIYFIDKKKKNNFILTVLIGGVFPTILEFFLIFNNFGERKILWEHGAFISFNFLAFILLTFNFKKPSKIKK